MPKMGFSSQDGVDWAQEMGMAIINRFGLSTEDIDNVGSKRNGNGVLITVTAGERQHRYHTSDVDQSTQTPLDATRAAPDGRGGTLQAAGVLSAVATRSFSLEDLGAYKFAPEIEIEDDQQLFSGLLCRGDLGVWIGREKHRKSNVILQFAICAAVGRDFLSFKFAATQPLKVVLIDFESKGTSLKQRYRGIAKALGLSEEECELLEANLTIIEIRRIRKAGLQFPKFSSRASQDTSFWEELVARSQADLYIIDPLRTLHAADENDSSMETLLTEMQRVFRGAAVITAHHMRKPMDNARQLPDDMRAWSEGARGSSAIKASADVIILQERTLDSNGNEIVHLGAFLKDGPDIEPFQMMESDHESFYWEVEKVIPAHLKDSYDALTQGGGDFRDRARAAEEIRRRTGVSRATAYRHIDAMLRNRLFGGGSTTAARSEG